MSLAGILASSLFSGAGSKIAQQWPAKGLGSDLQSGNIAGAQSSFAALQQKLSAQGSSTAGSSTSVSGEMTQLGQDLNAGNLGAAQADFASLKLGLSRGPVTQLHHTHTQPVLSVGSGGAPGSSTLTPALQAYSSLQQDPLNSALSSSMMVNPSTFSVVA